MSGSYVQHVVDIPAVMLGARELSVTIDQAQGLDGIEWSSPWQEIAAELFAK
jgi:hypothetical protein